VQKEIFILPENDKFGCILTPFLQAQPRNMQGFYDSVAKKAYRDSANVIQKFTIRPGVGGPTIARPSPEYATVRYAFGIKLQIHFVNVNVIGGVDDSPPCALVKYLSHRRQTRHPFLDTLSSSSSSSSS